MTIKELEEIYDRDVMCAGDSTLDFYKWAVTYLLSLVNKKKGKNVK